MPTPSVKQLEAFWWAATCTNFATAAERVHLSVSSLSKRISELENSLGHQLFDRSGHRAVLTDAGQRLLPLALGVINAMAALSQSLDASEALSGRCRFGVGDLSALTWLPYFVATVRQRHPQLSLDPYVDVGGVLERRLADGELDFAVIAGRSSRSEILAHPIGAAHFSWTVASNLPNLAGLSTTDLLKRLPLVTLPQTAGTTRLLDEWLQENQTVVQERILCNSWGAVAGMLRLGVGVGFLPTNWVRPNELRTLDSPVPLKPLHYTYQWRRGDARSLISTLQKIVRECVDFQHQPFIV